MNLPHKPAAIAMGCATELNEIHVFWDVSTPWSPSLYSQRSSYANNPSVHGQLNIPLEHSRMEERESLPLATKWMDLDEARLKETRHRNAKIPGSYLHEA